MPGRHCRTVPRPFAPDQGEIGAAATHHLLKGSPCTGASSAAPAGKSASSAAAPAASRARDYDAWFTSSWGRYAWAIETKAILAEVAPLTGRHVADVGCGTGRLLAALARGGAEAIGIDIDPWMLALAAGRGTVIRADAHRLPLADSSVDAAVTIATLEFTTDPATVLAEMARITRPGGLLAAAVLNPASLWGLLDQPARRAPYATGCFLPRTRLLALGGRHGRARMRGWLFAARQLPALGALGPPLELAGRLAPRYGALQVLTVITR
jgi:SAM-dependent methyltransferase